MEIKTVTKVFVNTTDGKELNENDLVIYATGDGQSTIAHFIKLNKRGGLVFRSALGKSEYVVMPKSIASIYLAEDIFKGDVR